MHHVFFCMLHFKNEKKIPWGINKYGSLQFHCSQYNVSSSTDKCKEGIMTISNSACHGPKNLPPQFKMPPLEIEEMSNIYQALELMHSISQPIEKTNSFLDIFSKDVKEKAYKEYFIFRI